MSEVLIILLPILLAFALALAAWVGAIVLRRPVAIFANSQNLKTRASRILFPPGLLTTYFGLYILSYIVSQVVSEAGGSGRVEWPSFVSLLIYGTLCAVYYANLLRRLSDGSPLRSTAQLMFTGALLLIGIGFCLAVGTFI